MTHEINSERIKEIAEEHERIMVKSNKVRAQLAEIRNYNPDKAHKDIISFAMFATFLLIPIFTVLIAIKSFTSHDEMQQHLENNCVRTDERMLLDGKELFLYDCNDEKLWSKSYE